ncbi:FxsA family protein [Oceanibium sediminis]|uniref:FxsA family protein n=1 Tax=Oceanibium sediminis TaxID=2026339 RepID=UPI000DD35411|nr:FxsA family protein [Oceanibium sediminis]
MWLFVPFVLVPIIEIALFIQVGGLIGLWPTLAIVVLTAVAGTWLMRTQGMAVLAELQGKLNQGGNPTGPIAHGAMILFAGAMLLTPGFFTDTLGFLLLLPPVRAALIRFGAAKLAGNITIVGGASSMHTRHGHSDDVIEAEYHAIDPDDLPPDDAPRGQSGWTKPR